MYYLTIRTEGKKYLGTKVYNKLEDLFEDAVLQTKLGRRVYIYDQDPLV